MDRYAAEPAVRILVKFGASPNQESAFGNTAVAQAGLCEALHDAHWPALYV